MAYMDYRREIDGLRALAVLPVILFHAGFQTFSGGFVGVDIFFVISGYLITSIILAEMEAGTFTLANFYERRARRILPALFVLMALCLPFAWLWLLPQDMKSFSQSLVAVSTFASNILFWRTSGYFDTAAELKPLLHTWSLAVEEQYYLLFPLFVLLTWRFGKTWILKSLFAVFIISLAAAHWGATTHPVLTFFLLPTRGWELLIGGFIAFYFSLGHKQLSHKWLNELGSLIGVALIAYSIFSFDSKTPIPSLYTLVPTIGTALIIFFTTPQTSTGKLLGSQLFVGVGLISYSAYLYHQPLLAFAKHRSIDEPSSQLIGLLVATTFLLAYFSWRFVEAPFRNKQRINRKQLLIFCILASFTFALFGLIGHFNKGYKFRVSDEVLAYTNIQKEHEELRDDNGCNVEANFALAGCVKGDKTKLPKVALVGDSHAAALAFELDKSFLKVGYSFLQYTKNSCPFAPFINHSSTTLNCNKYQKAYLKDFESNNVETYIVAGRWANYLNDSGFNNEEGGVEWRGLFDIFSANEVLPDSPHSFRKASILNAYSMGISKLLSAGKRVVLVYPIPEQGWGIPLRAAKAGLFGIELSINSVKRDVIERRYSEVVSLFDSFGAHKNLVRIFPTKIFCDEERCASSLQGVLLYYDDDHLSNEGAKLVVKEILKTLTN
jgi:peptidoglycan/LPS O-acetylase OafA/YrhL